MVQAVVRDGAWTGTAGCDAHLERDILRNTHSTPRPSGLSGPAKPLNTQIRDHDEYFAACQNDLMALGHCLEVKLLALPPTCKKAPGEWTLRPEGPLTRRLHRLPYPIPPAGADPSTYKSEEAAPLGFRLPMPQGLIMMDSGLPEVFEGWGHGVKGKRVEGLRWQA